MSDHRKHYTGAAVGVSYDPVRCRHAAECVRGLPAAFDTDRRPWILPDGADAEDIVRVVARCPTGALASSPPRHGLIARARRPASNLRLMGDWSNAGLSASGGVARGLRQRRGDEALHRVEWLGASVCSAQDEGALESCEEYGGIVLRG
jgi:uncharacterized Fe-S cluster protein YjdI